MDPKNELVIVFAGSITEAHLVQNVLEDAGLESALWDEQMAVVDLPVASPGGVGAVKVVVAPIDTDLAVKAIKEAHKTNFKPLEDY